MEIRFDDKRALVTGAGKGIGRELVKALVQCGAETFALSRTKSDLDSLKEEVKCKIMASTRFKLFLATKNISANDTLRVYTLAYEPMTETFTTVHELVEPRGLELLPKVHTVLVDLCDWTATRKAVQDIGPIDLLVNNAAIARVASFFDVIPEDIQETYDTNVKAVFNVSQVVCKGMIERGVGGSVVNISSQTSMVASKNMAVYASSKGALDVITKVMALELGPRQIRVNAVNPTVVWTPMVRNLPPEVYNPDDIIGAMPLKRAAEIEEVVNTVLFLLSDKAAMIHGARLPIDGGRTIV